MKFEIEQVFVVMAGAALGAIIMMILGPIVVAPITTAIRKAKTA